MFQAIIPAIRAAAPVALNVAKTTVKVGYGLHLGIIVGAGSVQFGRGAYRLGKRGVTMLRERAAIRRMERDIENELDACAIIADHF